MMSLPVMDSPNPPQASTHLLRMDGTPPSKDGTPGQQSDGAHPTGMLSCLLMNQM